MDEDAVGRRKCMACGAVEDGYNLVVYPVWAWYGRFMGRWCDWCREVLCWDCGEPSTKCHGDCTDMVLDPKVWGKDYARAS